MEDGNKDYLTVYRKFFEGFATTVDLYDQLPVKVPRYNVAETELYGEIIDWCLQYLNQRNCPHFLALSLSSTVRDEIRQVYKSNLDYFGYRPVEKDFHTLRLMQVVIKKLIEVCIRYTDNALLCTLLPPPPACTLQAAPVSAHAFKNTRRTMEDRHVAIQDLHALFNLQGCGSASYYAVFDGHNGSDAAVYSASHLHQFLVESSFYPVNPELALKVAFHRTDVLFNAKCEKENLRSGTTAVCALLRPAESMLYVAWLGDSQAVLVIQGKPYQLVKPHKPDQPEERKRIEEMGGTVLFWGTWRVNGQLAVSRAIGDIDYKPYVCGDPDVRVIPLTGQEDFLILACDGLWDFMTEQEVTDTVYSHLAEFPEDIEGVSQRLVQEGKAHGSSDNISVLVVFLKEPGGKGSGDRAGMDVSLDICLHQNGKPATAENPQETLYDDEDLGPETDVDTVDDVLLSPSIIAAKAMASSRSPVPGLDKVWVPHQKLQEQQENWLKTLPWSYADAVRNPAKKSPTRQDVEPTKQEADINRKEVPQLTLAQTKEEEAPKADDVVEGEAESGDDSDEEWNYIRGEEKLEVDQKQEEDQDDMESRLNPNAAEFVPGLQLDPVLASSPLKGKEKSLEDIIVPSLNEFCSEIAQRPSQIEPVCEKSDTTLAETSLNGGDETEGFSTKAEFGDESTYSISMNTSVAFLTDEENRLSETNPFSNKDNQYENEFVNDHFSLPKMEFKDDEPLQHAVGDESLTVSPDSDRPNSANQDIATRPQDFDSPYDFTSNTDALSPIDLPERFTGNQEPTSSSGFDSESNEEIDSNIQEKTIDGISFGDGVDIDEILKSKQDVDTPVKETDSLMTESLVDNLNQVLDDSEEHLKSDCLIQDEKPVERPMTPNKNTESDFTLLPLDDIKDGHILKPEVDSEDLPKEDIIVEDSAMLLESPVNDTPGIEHGEIVSHVEEISGALDQKVIEEPSPNTISDETNRVVDFIQELYFNESPLEKEESHPHSNDNTIESKIDEDIEIVVETSHEFAKELELDEIKSESAKELSNVDEKLLMDKNEMEMLSPQSDEAMLEDQKEDKSKDDLLVNVDVLEDTSKAELTADISVLEPEQLKEEIIVHNNNDFKKESIFESYTSIQEELSVSIVDKTSVIEEVNEITRFDSTIEDEHTPVDNGEVSKLSSGYLQGSQDLSTVGEKIGNENIILKTEDEFLDSKLGEETEEQQKVIVSEPEIKNVSEFWIKGITDEALIGKTNTDVCSDVLSMDETEVKQEKEDDRPADVPVSFDVQAAETTKLALEPLVTLVELTKVDEDISVGTPPSTPAPEPAANNKEGLIAAAVAPAAIGAATVVAASAISTLVENDEGKHDSAKKSTSATTPIKKPGSIKPSAVSVPSPSKSVAKSPTKPAGPATKKPAPASTLSGTKPITKPTTPPAKPSTPTSKTGATKVSSSKPITSATKTAVASTIKTTAASTIKTTAKTTAPAQAKPKLDSASKPAAAKPSAPAPIKAKPAPKPSSAEKPAAKKEDLTKKPTATSKPLPVSKAAPTAKPTSATKPTAPATKTAAPATKTAAPAGAVKRPPSQSAPVKPASAAKPAAATASTKTVPKPQPRPASSKPPGSATSKPSTATTKTVTNTTTASKTVSAKTNAAAPKPTQAKPSTSAKPKAPATSPPANKAKSTPPPIKKPAPIDKSVKDATNNKLSVELQGKKIDPKSNKKILLDDEKNTPLIDVPSLIQEHKESASNGHLDIFENGIGINQDSPTIKLHPETIEALN